MNTGTTFKRTKRRLKKKLYHFLLKLDQINFSKLRPVCYILLIAVALLALTKLPTPETTRIISGQTAYSAVLASAVRSTVSAQNSYPVDVVALFLSPESYSQDSAKAFNQEVLYSFYLTGTELSYLAEGAITTSSKDTTLYLDGLNYTYHQNRLPFNRVTELSTVSGTKIVDNQLYHIISTEDIFSLFHYISYRSLGVMDIYPKDAAGTLLSDYQEVILTEAGMPFTLGAAQASYAAAPACTAETSSVVTIQRGFNLIQLLKEPNQITVCVCALFIALLALLWYIVPRINRIRLWFRIYRIRSKKRSTHSIYGLKKRF